jgi:hypothetical protein
VACALSGGVLPLLPAASPGELVASGLTRVVAGATLTGGGRLACCLGSSDAQ